MCGDRMTGVTRELSMFRRHTRIVIDRIASVSRAFRIFKDECEKSMNHSRSSHPKNDSDPPFPRGLGGSNLELA